MTSDVELDAKALEAASREYLSHRGLVPSMVSTRSGGNELWEIHAPAVAAAITTYLAALPVSEPAPVGEGWKLVPVEPTPEMLAAALQAWNTQVYPTNVGPGPMLYGAMLAAAPPTIAAEGK